MKLLGRQILSVVKLGWGENGGWRWGERSTGDSYQEDPTPKEITQKVFNEKNHICLQCADFI